MVAVAMREPPAVRAPNDRIGSGQQRLVTGPEKETPHDVPGDGRLGAIHPLAELREQAREVPLGRLTAQDHIHVLSRNSAVSGRRQEGVVKEIVQPDPPAAELRAGPVA